MRAKEINIRDPFILVEDGTYYLYGTRAASFGRHVGGFDVYTSTDLAVWSDPTPCFTSADYGLNTEVNWAPEVHKWRGAYYMFATFTKENGLRGTYVLKADRPMGPFRPHSDGAVTPFEWECLDGTLYVEDGKPYLVFCHEHTQIIDGTICYLPLSDDLSAAVGEPVLLFHGSDPSYVKKRPDGRHYVTDGPFLYKTTGGALLMLWSTILNGQYAECLVRFPDGSITGAFEHLPPLIDSDGGHGMLFSANGLLLFTYHTPNSSGDERVAIVPVEDTGDCIQLM